MVPNMVVLSIPPASTTSTRTAALSARRAAMTPPAVPAASAVSGQRRRAQGGGGGRGANSPPTTMKSYVFVTCAGEVYMLPARARCTSADAQRERRRTGDILPGPGRVAVGQGEPAHAPLNTVSPATSIARLH